MEINVHFLELLKLSRLVSSSAVGQADKAWPSLFDEGLSRHFHLHAPYVIQSKFLYRETNSKLRLRFHCGCSITRGYDLEHSLTNDL